MAKLDANARNQDNAAAFVLSNIHTANIVALERLDWRVKNKLTELMDQTR
jgi:hypothetical protein